MREYIKGTERAAVMLFRRGSDADYARLDAIDAHNHGIAIRVYNGIMDGSTSYADIREGKRLIVYTRSLRGSFVQASYFADINGDIVATMHSDIHDHAQLAGTFIPGKYINIAS